MKVVIQRREQGNTIIISVVAMAILGGFVAFAVDYTGNVARNSTRDRVFNEAVEVGDGCISQAFASWRQLCKTAGTANPTTANFAAVPTPNPADFPSFPTLSSTPTSIANFRVQAVDQTMTLASDNPPISALLSTAAPPGATGPGTGTISYFYLASVDVTLPALTGTLTAKVRRVFEKRYTSAWNWAMLYNQDLELHPDAPLTLTGWVHSNKDVYVGNGTTDSSLSPATNLTFTDRLTSAGAYNVGFSSLDAPHSGYVNVANPTTEADYPPGKEAEYNLFGWDTTQFDTSDSNPNNDGYHEMIEKASNTATYADPFATQRVYDQAYTNNNLIVNIDASNAISMGYNGVTYNSQPSGGNTPQRSAWDAVTASVHPGYSIQDNREAGTVRVVNFDVAQFNAQTIKNGFGGIIYINDTSATSSAKRAVRVLNGATLTSGMTIASPNPVYIQGDFNTGKTSSAQPPSNTGDPTNPEASGYSRKPASIMADAVTLLSNNWSDSNSTAGLSSRIASNTTVNAALVAGNVPSDGVNYSGGGENFVRFMEDWTGKRFTYYGSMLCPFGSTQGTGIWGTAGVYAAAQQYWYFDKQLSVDSSGNSVTVPGYVATVAYLQQQRWYLQY